MAGTWHSMEDAPRDGTSLLLCDRDGVFIGHWYGGHAFGFWTDGTEIEDRFTQRQPMAWMPLPPLPNLTF